MAACVLDPRYHFAEEAYSRETVGSEWLPIRRIDIEGADDYDEENTCELDHYHRRIKAGALFYADYQHDGNNRDYHDGRDIDDRTGRNNLTDVRTIIDWGPTDRRRKIVMKHAKDALKVRRPTVCDCCRTHCVFQNQVPSDDPGEQFTQRRIRIGI